jgi:pyruvate formate lyase activating enzyme
VDLTKGLVSNIQRYSVSDGPGIRTTVFLKGCPLGCKWCHNPESVSPEKQLILREDRCIGCGECLVVCEQHAIRREGSRLVTDRAKCVRCGRCVDVCYAEARGLVGREMSTDEVMREVSKDKVFYAQSCGGVTFSGGEPFHQPEFLLSLLKASRAQGIHTAVDTSGHFLPELFGRADGLVNLYLFDLKTLDEARHRDFTGVSNTLILENLRALVEHRNRVVVRVPIVPKFNDDLAEIRRIGLFVEGLPGVDEIHILPYHKSGVAKYQRLGQEYGMEQAAEPTPERLEQLAAELGKHVARVVIGG